MPGEIRADIRRHDDGKREQQKPSALRLEQAQPSERHGGGDERSQTGDRDEDGPEPPGAARDPEERCQPPHTGSDQQQNEVRMHLARLPSHHDAETDQRDECRTEAAPVSGEESRPLPSAREEGCEDERERRDGGNQNSTPQTNANSTRAVGRRCRRPVGEEPLTRPHPRPCRAADRCARNGVRGSRNQRSPRRAPSRRTAARAHP